MVEQMPTAQMRIYTGRTLFAFEHAILKYDFSYHFHARPSGL